jgi:hypothetical protein
LREHAARNGPGLRAAAFAVQLLEPVAIEVHGEEFAVRDPLQRGRGLAFEEPADLAARDRDDHDPSTDDESDARSVW